MPKLKVHVMEQNLATKINMNESDVLKVFAVFGAILQSILGIMLKHTHQEGDYLILSFVFNLVKYTAPVFIFAIAYGMVKGNEKTKASHFYKEKFGELVVPYLLWATASLIFFPNLQVGTKVSSISSIIETYFVGNISPQFWYTVMMLQFQILMPVIIFLAYKFLSKPSRVIPTIIVSFIVFGAWLWYYDTYVFHGIYAKPLVYTDRLFISYFIYAILGGIAWVYKEQFDRVLRKLQFFAIPAMLLLLIWTNYEFLGYDIKKMSFGNLIYLKPSMTLYSLVVIIILQMFARHLISINSRTLPYYKWLSTYAYRAFTANVFMMAVVLKLFGHMIDQLPFVISLVMIYLTTLTCSYLVVYVLAQIWKGLKGMFSSNNSVASSKH